MDSQKYLKQYAALEEAAKSEIIEILSNNPTGRYIYFNEEIEEESEAEDNNIITTWDGDDRRLIIQGVGLDDENQIVVLNNYKRWINLDEFTLVYPEMYQFVVDNLKYAKQNPTLD